MSTGEKKEGIMPDAIRIEFDGGAVSTIIAEYYDEKQLKPILSQIQTHPEFNYGQPTKTIGGILYIWKSKTRPYTLGVTDEDEGVSVVVNLLSSKKWREAVSTMKALQESKP